MQRNNYPGLPIFIILFLFLIGALLVFTGVWRIFRHMSLDQWIETPAKVDMLEAYSQHDMDGTAQSRTRLQYRYHFSGNEYISRAIDVFGSVDVSDDLFQHLKRQQRADKPITVWVNPAAPDIAVITRDFNYSVLAMIICGLVFWGVGGLFGWCSFRHAGSAGQEVP